MTNLHSLMRWLLTVFLFTAVHSRAGWIEDRPDGTVLHVKVFDLPDPARNDPFSRAEAAAVTAFKKQFNERFDKKYRSKYEADPKRYGNHDWSNVSIELEAFTGITVQGVEVDLLAIAGGMAPDVLYLNFRKSDNYIRNGFLYPLDQPEDGYLAEMKQEAIDQRINPKLWPVLRRNGTDGKEHVWALPYGGALGKVLFFRRDLFEQAGLPYPNASSNWNDILEASRKITDPEKGIYGFKLGRGKHESFYWLSFLWSAGGEVMIQEDDQWRCCFDSPEAAKALDFYIQLSAEKWIDNKGHIRRGYSTKDVAQVSAKWARGEIGMMLDYIDEKLFSTIDPEVTGIAPVPLGPTGLRGGELNSRMMALFSGIPDRAIRDAAWEYMLFYDSDEAMALKTRIMVEGGLGRFINPKYLQRYGYPEIERLAPKGWSDIFDIAIASGKPEPYGRNSNYAYDEMTRPIQKAEQMALNDQLAEDETERLVQLQDLLNKACIRANEEMMGLIPPSERRLRRMAAALFLLCSITAFSLVFRRISRGFSHADAPCDSVQQQSRLRRASWVWSLLLPALLSILLWKYVPLLRGSVMAFQDYSLLGHSTWVGLDNFGDMLFDGIWWRSIWNALRYSTLVMAMTFLPPIILAILLQEVPKGRLLLRLIYYLPAVISGLVTIVLWKQFYAPSENGALNRIVLSIPAGGFILIAFLFLALCLLFARRLLLNEMPWQALLFVGAGLILFITCTAPTGSIFFPSGESWVQSLQQIPMRIPTQRPEAYRWLSDEETAMLSCVIPMLWAGMGPGCLIYLAALKGIPDDYYEAADIDGATFIDKILFIVFPTLKPLIIIQFVGAFIGSWYSATGNILVMTGGAANTEVAGLHIWYKAFTYLKFGPATAMAWMLGFLLIGFTVQQLQILSRVEFRATGAKER